MLEPVLKYWKVFDLEGLSGEAEKARESLATFLDDLDRKANRFEERRETLLARQARG